MSSSTTSANRRAPALSAAAALLGCLAITTLTTAAASFDASNAAGAVFHTATAAATQGSGPAALRRVRTRALLQTADATRTEAIDVGAAREASRGLLESDLGRGKKDKPAPSTPPSCPQDQEIEILKKQVAGLDVAIGLAVGIAANNQEVSDLLKAKCVKAVVNTGPGNGGGVVYDLGPGAFVENTRPTRPVPIVPNTDGLEFFNGLSTTRPDYSQAGGRVAGSGDLERKPAKPTKPAKPDKPDEVKPGDCAAQEAELARLTAQVPKLTAELARQKLINKLETELIEIEEERAANRCLKN